MAETQRIAYVRLFEVRVLHHFWLDEGGTVFDKMTDAAKMKRLLSYDVRTLLSFQPSRATSTLVTGLRGVFRATGLGFLVGVPHNAEVPLDAVFEFHVTVVDPAYAAYTAQPTWREGVTAPTVPALRPQPIVSVLESDTDPETGMRTLHRYKANVPVLSNLTGVSTGAGPDLRLYLSQGYPEAKADDALESLAAVNDELRQRVGDPDDAVSNRIGLLADLPVFVHQGDVPAITPPAASTGAPAFGIELAADTPPQVNAVIRLVPHRSNGSPFNFADPSGQPVARVFEVHLQNRWTTWQYFDKRDGAPIPSAADPLPLTHFGNAGSKQKPQPTAIGAVLDNHSPQRIVRLVSDIYV